MLTFSTIVDENIFFASLVAASYPKSTKMIWRPDNNCVSGPNIGCIEVALHPESIKSLIPCFKGVFNEPISNIKPFGFFFAKVVKTFTVDFIGVATTITSCSILSFNQSIFG